MLQVWQDGPREGRLHGGTYATDAKDGGTLPMSATRLRRDIAVATDGGALLISAPRRKKKLCWRCLATTVMTVRFRLKFSSS